MSSIAISTVRAPARDIYENIPRSMQIRMENSMLFAELDHIEITIGQEWLTNRYRQYACRYTQLLTNIINVFNDNVNYANKEIEKFIPFEKRTIEQYSAEHPNCTPEDYDRDESLRKSEFDEKNYEVAELYQLGGVLRILGEKITRVRSGLWLEDRLDDTMSRSPVIACVIPEYEKLPSFFNFKSLRTVETPKVLPVLQEPVNDTPIETLVATFIETVDSASAPTALKIDVTVFCNLSSEKILGICCHPTWGEQPTLFTKSENNSWTGQVPVDQDWKFITLENGQVKGWEQGKNRRCNSQTQAFTVKPNEVKFS